MAKRKPAAELAYDYDGIANAIKAVADPARLRILNLLATALQPMPVFEIVKALNGPAQPTVSHHLRILHERGLANREKTGVFVVYSVDREALGELLGTIGERAGLSVATS